MTAAVRGEIEAGREGGAAALLERSRQYCQELTRREAKNFYYGLKLLKEPKRSAMYALYAYMRLVDDIADDESNGRTVGQRAADLDQWAALTHEAIAAGSEAEAAPRGHIVWPAFGAMVRRYRVPVALFDEMIAGQRQDLEPVRMATFDDLHAYCYRVASVVGVASLYVWGFDGGEATVKLSVERGIAFQLTNVLRDLREDAAKGGAAGRCYLPADEMARFGVSEQQIARGEATGGFLELMRFQIERARGYYESSAPLHEKVAPDARATLGAMTAIYRGILEKIAEEPGRVLRERVSLGKMKKLMIGWRAMRGG
ncbi:MAG TPA: phytoene/squalene synthase family protein [Phycisphaerae bacterium]|nr:phytoene/squalene synthase family protein [Phycisphaerae bacterium]